MVGNFGNVFVVALYLQQHLGLSPLNAGFVFLPSAFFAIAGNLLSGVVTDRFGARVPVVAACCPWWSDSPRCSPRHQSGSPG